MINVPNKVMLQFAFEAVLVPLRRERVRFTQIDCIAMGAKRLPGRSSPSTTYSATVVIEFTATLGVMSVRKELPVAPKTLLGIHTVFGDENE